MALWGIKCTASPHASISTSMPSPIITQPITQAVLSTLVHRARALCDEDSLQHELVFLRDVFKLNGYNDRQIRRALNRSPHLYQPDNQPNSVAFLPFVGTTFSHIIRVLARHNIKSVGLPHMKLSSLLCPVKDHLGLRTSSVYTILWARQGLHGTQAVPWISG
jgi:hypothetical protein